MTDNKNKKELLTYSDIYGDNEFPMFKTEKERIEYMKKAYGNMSIAKSFSIFYGIEVTPETKQNKQINNVITIELGQIYSGYVKSFDKNGMIFELPGVKESIISKENFNDCAAEVNAFLSTHGNKLLFEVREHKNNQYIVSVINAYYRYWLNTINKAIQYEQGIQVHIDSLVKGIDSPLTNIIEEDGIDMSGGEKQKLALARALYKGGKFVVLDEPTSALDAIAEQKLYESFDEMIGQKSAVYISHRLASTRFCDRIAMFEKGSLIELGTHDELMAQNGKYAEMFNVQAQYYREDETAESEVEKVG